MGRVAFVYDHLYPFSVGGAERYYWTLSRALADQGPVTQIAPRLWDGPRVRTEGGVEQVGLAGPVEGRYPAKLTFVLALLWHFLRHGRRYEVVHCAGFPAVALLATWLGLTPHRRTRLVADWHEVLPRSTWHGRCGGIGELGWLAQKLAIHAGDAAVTYSRMHAGRLHAEGRAQGVALMPEFTPEAQTAVAEAGQREALVLFAGRLVAEKRADLVPAVVGELRRADPERGWRGVIFGSGEREEAVRAAVRAAGVEDAVELAGFAPWEEVSRAMHRAAALVFPSRREGFGLAVLEATAHGLPAVLVEHPDNASTELIEEGVNGHVCAGPEPAELAAAVLALVGDPGIHAHTREWYERARQRFSVENAAREMGALHARLLSGGA